MRTLSIVLYVLAAISLIVLSIIPIQNAVRCGSIDSWLERAKDAGNPGQVSEFLVNYKVALNTAGLVEGKYSSVFRYPATYMPVYVRTIDGLIGRANALTVQNPTDTSYQMGLVNLEKDLGDMNSAAFSVYYAYWGWLYVALLWWAVPLVFLIAGLWADNF